MGSTCIEPNTGIPKDFVKTFWITPVSEFPRFLQRLEQNKLLFTIDIPADHSDGPSVKQQIGDEMKERIEAGGPALPLPSKPDEVEPSRHWEVLSCKNVNVKSKDLRGASGRGNAPKQGAIEIKALSEVLAPVDYDLGTLVKSYGFKNPFQINENEPKMFIFIGQCIRWPTDMLLHDDRSTFSWVLQRLNPKRVQ